MILSGRAIFKAASGETEDQWAPARSLADFLHRVAARLDRARRLMVAADLKASWRSRSLGVLESYSIASAGKEEACGGCSAAGSQTSIARAILPVKQTEMRKAKHSCSRRSRLISSLSCRS